MFNPPPPLEQPGLLGLANPLDSLVNGLVDPGYILVAVFGNGRAQLGEFLVQIMQNGSVGPDIWRRAGQDSVCELLSGKNAPSAGGTRA